MSLGSGFRCCLNTPDPGPWTAGVDDSADPYMIEAMHSIRDNLSRSTPLFDFIRMLRRAVNIDSRTTLGGDIQRCLLSGVADRLVLISQNIDPAPWRTMRERVGDSWAVFKGRAVAIPIRGTVYDEARKQIGAKS